MDNEKPYGMGIFLDIYPYDGMGDTWENAVKFEKRGDYLSSLCFQASRNHLEKGITKSKFRMAIKLPVFIICKLIGKDYFQNKLREQREKYPYDESRYVGNAVWGNGGTVCIYERKLFEDFTMVEFEGERFRAPSGYDAFLKHIYGDYMKLPPEQNQKPHHGYYVIENPAYFNN